MQKVPVPLRRRKKELLKVIQRADKKSRDSVQTVHSETNRADVTNYKPSGQCREKCVQPDWLPDFLFGCECFWHLERLGSLGQLCHLPQRGRPHGFCFK